VTRSIRLANDLINCPGEGLVVGADGITVDLAGHTIDGAIGAGDDGINVATPDTTVTGNRALHNGDLGIEAVAGVTDGGGNRAFGNGNPVQCTNVLCE